MSWVKRTLIGAGVVAVGLGVLYGGLDLAGAAPLAAPTPMVIVSNTSTNPVPVQQQGAATVNVNNTSLPVSGTVKTSALDNPAFHPISATEGSTLGDGQGSTAVVVYTVPSGKEFVITGISAEIQTASSQVVAGASCEGIAGGGEWSYYINTEPQGSSGGQVDHQGAAQTQLYADGGQDVICTWARGDTKTGSAAASFSLIGYLVNVPS
jgi:hypothetical protein